MTLKIVKHAAGWMVTEHGVKIAGPYSTEASAATKRRQLLGGEPMTLEVRPVDKGGYAVFEGDERVSGIWTIPENVLLDNGREFAAKAITGGPPNRFRFKVRQDDISGLLTSLGCQIHWAMPYSGQSKPIERAFRDLCDRVAKHPAFQGAYTGNSLVTKPEDYGTRAVPLDIFVGVLREEIELHNARPDRCSEVAFGRSFTEVRVPGPS